MIESPEVGNAYANPNTSGSNAQTGISQMNLEQIFLKHLEKWPIYNSSHQVMTHATESGIWIGYRKKGLTKLFNSTHFDVNIIGNTFYLLSIELETKDRGKGHGKSLYKILEDIAKQTGCSKIEMTASGWTKSGVPRAEYMMSLGYEVIGYTAKKEFK